MKDALIMDPLYAGPHPSHDVDAFELNEYVIRSRARVQLIFSLATICHGNRQSHRRSTNAIWNINCHKMCH